MEKKSPEIDKKKERRMDDTRFITGWKTSKRKQSKTLSTRV